MPPDRPAVVDSPPASARHDRARERCSGAPVAVGPPRPARRGATGHVNDPDRTVRDRAVATHDLLGLAFAVSGNAVGRGGKGDPTSRRPKRLPQRTRAPTVPTTA